MGNKKIFDNYCKNEMVQNIPKEYSFKAIIKQLPVLIFLQEFDKCSHILEKIKESGIKILKEKERK